MKSIYTARAQEAILCAEKVSKRMKHPYIGSEHLLVGLLKQEDAVAANVLMENNISCDVLLNLISDLVVPCGEVRYQERDGKTPRLIRILETAAQEAERMQEKKIGTEHLLIAILKEPECVAARLLNTMGANPKKLYLELMIAMGEDPQTAKELLQQAQSAGEGETPVLDQFSRDLTDMARMGKLDPVIGREEEIHRLIQILCRRRKNNPCLIGEPGVGKTAVVEGLAQAIAAGKVPPAMQEKRLVILDLSGMVAGTKYRGEFEERIKRVMEEAIRSSNVLLFLDELHTLIGAGDAEGAMDAANILKPALSRGELQLIGATTQEEYRKYVEKDAALERRFQPVTVEAPDVEKTVAILKGLRGHYEEHHQVAVTDEALKAAARLSDRYVSDRQLPDKAIDLMDEAAARKRLEAFTYSDSMQKLEKKSQKYLEALEESLQKKSYAEASYYAQEKEKVDRRLETAKKRFLKEREAVRPQVTEEDIAAVVSEWTKIPVQRLATEEMERLRNLESLLHQRVIGQEEAITAVAKAVRRGRVGLKDPKRPIGSFLFLGPTGVGKTEVAKALAEAVFGDESAMIRVDMSEYTEEHSVAKFIGTPPGYIGYEDGGRLSQRVRSKPYSVVLFDEMEKAHPNVLQLLLQILDDGHITDSQGRKVDFKNTILIMTSNVGARSIVEPKRLGFASKEDANEDYLRMKQGVTEELRTLFKPEFLNRIDDTIIFHALSREDLAQIVFLMTKTLEERAKTQMNLTVQITPEAAAYLAESSYDPKYGARPLRRAIQNQVEDALAEKIIGGQLASGDTVQVILEKGAIAFRKK